MEGSFSSVVSLCSLCICLVAAELNSLQSIVGDISSAYLVAYTKEKVYFTSGPELGVLQGHTFVIEKALYGLYTSGASWHQCIADTLRDLQFTPCLADPDVWWTALCMCLLILRNSLTISRRNTLQTRRCRTSILPPWWQLLPR
jgi:Reverse transcriptase (RNA-dependent DNA polymerase)